VDDPEFLFCQRRVQHPDDAPDLEADRVGVGLLDPLVIDVSSTTTITLNSFSSVA
jgi:hypothetical protein